MDIQDPLKPLPLVPPGMTLEQALADPQRQDQIAMGQRFMQQAGPPDSLLTSMGVPDKLNDALAHSNIANFGPGMVRSGVNLLTLPGDAWNQKVDPMSNEGIDRSLDAASMLTLGAGAMPAAEGELGMGIRAYHGSPHDFDAFDMSKIGTGEGAQVYGHGLYFAENEGVAKQYRNDLAHKGNKVFTPQGGEMPASLFYGDDATKKAFRALKDAGSYDVARQRLATELDNVKAWGKTGDETAAALGKLDELKAAGYDAKAGGKTYEVSINADPEHFLDWDKPLSEQPKAVQDAVHGVFREGKLDGSLKAASRLYGSSGVPEHLDTMTGERINQLMASLRTSGQAFSGPWPILKGNKQGSIDAAEALRAAGIKGIRYKDAGSRFSPNWRIWSPKENGTLKWSVGNDTLGGQIQSFDNEAQARAFYHDNRPSEPTHNYVVFDDKIIDILKKYGIAGLTGGGLAAALAAKAGLVTPPQDAAPAPQKWPAILGVRG